MAAKTGNNTSASGKMTDTTEILTASLGFLMTASLKKVSQAIATMIDTGKNNVSAKTGYIYLWNYNSQGRNSSGKS